MENLPAGVDRTWLSLLTDALSAAVWSTDADLRITAIRGVAGGSEMIGRRLDEALRLDGSHPVVLAHRLALAGDSAACDVPWPSRALRSFLEPMRDENGTVVGVAGAGVPVEVVREAAMLDRSAFLAAVDARMRAAETGGAALVVLDLDAFGALNGRLGHAAGDAVLAEVGRRLAACVRSGDLIGKTGSDEFAVLVHGVERDARRVGERLREALTDPIETGGAAVQVRASAGVVLMGSQHAAQDALRLAQTAMSRAKADGRDRCVASTGPLDARSASLERMEAELRRALGRDEMRAHFEPMVAVKSGRVDGFEVLLWRRTARNASRSAGVPTPPA